MTLCHAPAAQMFMDDRQGNPSLGKDVYGDASVSEKSVENLKERHADEPRTQGRCMWGESGGTPLFLVFILFLLLYLPFVNKAFHIDDAIFIGLSRMVGWNPLHAIPADYNYMGKILPNLIPYEITHPLLIPYIIKIIIARFGDNEIALHLVFMIFPLMALFSLMKLNMIFFPGSRIAVLLAVFFCSLPAFLVNAQNVMTDVPTLAFLLLAMAGFFDGLENGSRRMTYMGGIALTLAIFSSYQMLAFVPLIFLYALWRRKLTVHVALSLVFPLLVFLAWLIAVYALYDVIPLFKSKLSGAKASLADTVKIGLMKMNLIKKVLSVFAFIGAAMLWVIPLHHALKGAMRRFFLLLVPLVIACYLATFKLTGYPFSQHLVFSSFVSLGLLTCITLAQSVRVKTGDADAPRRIFLLLWFFCVVGYVIALFPFSAARYLLPAFPPAMMLLMSDPAWSFTTRARKAALSCVLCGALILALASALSDYVYANTYRDYASKIKEFRAANGNAFNVWYIGEWGMSYYMDRAGAKYLYANTNEPMVGDYLVISEMTRLWAPSLPLRSRLALVAEKDYRSRLPLRLFNKRSRAGFYEHSWGLLPFAFSSEPDDVFSLYRVYR